MFDTSLTLSILLAGRFQFSGVFLPGDSINASERRAYLKQTYVQAGSA